MSSDSKQSRGRSPEKDSVSKESKKKSRPTSTASISVPSHIVQKRTASFACDSRTSIGSTSSQRKKSSTSFNPWQKLLGETLVSNTGDTVEPAKLAAENGVIGLFFSADWCRICKVFLPDLEQLYQTLKKSRRSFEVVFVSFDETEETFKKYASSMPWLSMSFKEFDKRAGIAEKYSITSIPSLVLLDSENLKLISKHGRQIVATDPNGKEFPWKTMPEMKDLKPKKSLDNSKEGSDKEDLMPSVSEDNGAWPSSRVPSPKLSRVNSSEELLVIDPHLDDS